MPLINTRDERFYMQIATDINTIPHSTGAATVAAGDFCRHTRFDPRSSTPLINRPDKRPNLSLTKGKRGRTTTTWSLEMSLAGGGAAGTKSDADPLLEAAFGQAGTVSAGVSVTYSLADAIKFLALWSFRSPSDAEHRVTAGSVVSELGLRLGDDVAVLTASGQAKLMLTSGYFADATTEEKCGLTAWPAEPGSQTEVGDFIVGFTGIVQLDGSEIAEFQSLNLRYVTGINLPNRSYSKYYPQFAERGDREVYVDVLLDDSNAASVQSLKNKARSKTPVDIIAQAGTDAGNIVVVTIKNVCLEEAAYDDGGSHYTVAFNGSRAYATNVSAKDEISLVVK